MRIDFSSLVEIVGGALSLTEAPMSMVENPFDFDFDF